MTVDPDTWLYVAIQKNVPADKIVGQVDETHNISYIPAFLTKDAAQQAMFHLRLEKQKKYEIQAIICDDLIRHATEGGFVIFVLDEDGKVLEQLPQVS
ncbi:hypothetical protein LJC71_09845 [Desulfosarcina sp. OttesenSCG-928-A07]|nr:hypothetical protein [Desulfosarcina sp. OttesenSCG-928-A07]